METVEQSSTQEPGKEDQRVEHGGHVQPTDCDAGEQRGQRAVTGPMMVVLRQLGGIVGARGILWPSAMDRFCGSNKKARPTEKRAHSWMRVQTPCGGDGGGGGGRKGSRKEGGVGVVVGCGGQAAVKLRSSSASE